LVLVRVLEKKRYMSSGKGLTVVMVMCLNCFRITEIAKQNFDKHNRKQSTHCLGCITETFHNLTGTRPYRIWQGLRNRVKATKGRDGKNYGARGISVDLRWESFEVFWEEMSPNYADDLTIERVDVNGPYCKENCTWISMFDQQSNKRNNRVVTYQGETMHLAELTRRSGVSKMKLIMRLNRGLSGDEAVREAKESPYGKGPRAKGRRTSSTSLTADPDTSS
tara:strand:- start:144 stop:809 length:666 start_codon:yes stop_codon:yes gene_type:complete